MTEVRISAFRVALVRHSRALVASGICYGRLDLELHPDGAAEIARIAAELAGFGASAIWSSPARRCIAVAAALGPPAPLRTARLLELNFGAWEGMAWDDIDRAALDLWAASPMDFAPPGGESGAALIARVRSFHATLYEAGQDCVVVSHGGPLKVLRALLRGERIDLLAKPLGLGCVDIVTVGSTG